jgi:hypothetical protein
MTDENTAHPHATRWRRIRRVKRWLRPLPRRSNIHRYPLLRYFARTARQRTYLWSFRVTHAVPAIQAGCILTLLPLYGVQIALAFALALLLRANLAILVGLQIVSNPITILPLWYAGFQIGRITLGVIGLEITPLGREEVGQMLYAFTHADWGERFDNVALVFGVTSLGGLVMGSFFGLIVGLTYRIVADRTAASYALLRKKIQPRGEPRGPNPN